MSTLRDLHEGAETKVVVGQSAHGKLMSVVNGAGLVLDGIVFSPPNPHLAIVHVHGSLGNFYQQPFIRVFANRLTRHGIAVLSFNLTGHDGVSEGYTPDQKMQYIGGSLSRFETCLDDLDALLCFAGSICPGVVLQGHSLGCDRVLFYVQQRATRIPLILLSPCDSHRLQEIWLAGETISEQATRLSSESDDDEQVNLVSASEYGLAEPDGWTYSIPISRDALLSIITGPPFQILRVDSSTQPVSNAQLSSTWELKIQSGVQPSTRWPRTCGGWSPPRGCSRLSMVITASTDAMRRLLTRSQHGPTRLAY